MIQEKTILFAASLVLLGVAAVEAFQVDRAQRAAADWKRSSEMWEQATKDTVSKAGKALDMYRDLVWEMRARIQTSADDAAVCTSMLPAEQRKSFTGQQ
jgi:hypothetical protein